MYIILIALVLFILFYRKEDFTFYFKNLGESGGYLVVLPRVGLVLLMIFPM